MDITASEKRGECSEYEFFKKGVLLMLKRKANRIKAALAAGLIAASAIAVPVPASFAQKEVPLTAAAASDNYAKLLQYSLYFYDANMCGTQVSETTALDWRGDCHTGDEAMGGFHDAGDHAMFGQPQGYTAATLGWAYYEFKDAFNKTGQGAHLQTITDYFCQFFRASTKLDGSGNVTNFCYQKGDGDEDHAYWGPPEKQSNNRRQFWTSNSASDIAADYAAALAINYLNFGNAEDLKYAKALYAFSTKYNSIATDGPNGFYKSSSCQDEQAWAAGWLYLATKEDKYKNDCAGKQQQYIGWVHGWENKGLGAAIVNAYITNDWGKVNSYIGGQCTNPNAYFCMDKWGSARLNTTMQMCAMVATKHSNADYSNWCKSQMNYILGDNPARTCFVVGFADNSAKNPHHRAASGYNSYNELGNNTTSGPNAKVLVGALVGGPSDAGGTYQDNINDYVCNEVAIDYNAGFVGAAAALYAKYGTGSTVNSIPGVKKIYNSSSNPTTPPAQTTAPPQETTPQQTPQQPQQTTKPQDTPSTGGYKLDVNTSYTYNRLSEKMIGFPWEDFGIPTGEKPVKVEVNISTSADKIGTWQGAFGSSTSVDPDYWTQSEDMEEFISGTSGKITWELDSATSSIIQTQYGGELKVGFWWIDCNKFNIDSIVVYTNGSGNSNPPAASSNTTKPQQVTTTTTTTKQPDQPSDSKVTKYGDANTDNKVDILDVIVINKAMLGSMQLSDQGKANADVNKNGKPDNDDSLKVLKSIVGLEKLS